MMVLFDALEALVCESHLVLFFALRVSSHPLHTVSEIHR